MNLAVKCGKCGRWSAMTTKDINKAVLKCKCCGSSKKLRSKGSPNLDYKIVGYGLSGVVQFLNENN